FGAQANGLVSDGKAVNDALNVVQRASQTAAAAAINKLALRLAAGTDRLAQLVRKDQDLAGRPRLSIMRSSPPSPRSQQSATPARSSVSGTALQRSPQSARGCGRYLPRIFQTMGRSRNRSH